jgi:hypothetical protein
LEFLPFFHQIYKNDEGYNCYFFLTQFWKRTTQESFQQSLVEIGSVVSEEKIFFNFIPPFSIFSLVAFDRLCKLEKKGRGG